MKIANKLFASGKTCKQIIGAFIEWKPKSSPWFLTFFVICGLFIAKYALFEPQRYIGWQNTVTPYIVLLVITIFLRLVIKTCRTLTDIFSLRRYEEGITYCQMGILFAIGIWIIIALLILRLPKDHPYMIILSAIGALFAWIFQDSIKGMVAFIHLRTNKQLYIGDWIKVPKYNVDGTVEHVTLTTVTIYNWDTTTSTIPTSILHSDHLINYQRMTEGKTYGRRMSPTFIFDTSCFHTISAEEAAELRQQERITKYLPADTIKKDMLNAQIFRLYLFHWLMNHPHVSQQPNLIVRWQEQSLGGMALQVLAFLTEGRVGAFEWQQSQIMEHIMESMTWFGLRLYQSMSSYDVKDNVHIINQTQSFGKEISYE